jgi:hypothetical protein
VETIFRPALGFLPILECFTRFYSNYSVSNASNADAQRVYYTIDIPNIIHVTETCFVERQLCIYFEMQMAVSQFVPTPPFFATLISIAAQPAKQ